MTRGLLAPVFLTLSLLVPQSPAHAAELHVLAGGGIAGPLRELAAEFERMTGHKVVLRFDTTPELIKHATGGPFDVGVVPRELFNDAAAAAQFTETRTQIARVGYGVAVKSGSPKPDIGTPDALRKALLNARSIATTPASAAGAQVLRTFETLGISDEIKPKLKAQPGPQQIVDAVAKGEAELGVFLINVLTAPGLEVVGPFPAELQQELVYIGGMAAGTQQRDVAQAFLAHLRTPSSTALIKAKGMTPG